MVFGNVQSMVKPHGPKFLRQGRDLFMQQARSERVFTLKDYEGEEKERVSAIVQNAREVNWEAMRELEKLGVKIIRAKGSKIPKF